MRLNYETVIVGKVSILVPYRPEHVVKYHTWMQDPDLLEATGSEPLTLPEEYEMQQSWRDDRHKCTFIVLDKSMVEGSLVDSEASSSLPIDFITNHLSAMVGDVNLFLSEEEDDDDKDDDKDKDDKKYPQAELDIMIAEKDRQRNGLGREASLLMMMFGASKLGIRRFFCKIKEDNVASRSLFGDKLGFVQCAYAECFREVELELKRKDPATTLATLQRLLGETVLNTFTCEANDKDSNPIDEND